MNDDTDWNNIRNEVIKKEVVDSSDKIDKYIKIKLIDWFIKLDELSKLEIVFYNILFSLLLTIITDLFGGIGRKSLLFH